jgi:hypothetical protein
MTKYVLERITQRIRNPTEDSDFLNAVLKVHQKNPETIKIREVIAAVYINMYVSNIACIAINKYRTD